MIIIKSLNLVLLLSAGILFFSCAAQAQCKYPVFNKRGMTMADFIPKGWEMKDHIKGDFNQDGKEDIILVIASEEEHGENSFNFDCSRPMLILEGLQEGYALTAFNHKAVLCKACGGAFGDPYESISLNKQVLNINHYAGSAIRWSRNATFRYQQNQWVLIGISESSYWSLGECNGSVAEAGYNLSEVNFNTGKMHVVRTEQQECKPYKDTWIAFKKKPLVNLKHYDADKDYFPVKVK